MFVRSSHFQHGSFRNVLSTCVMIHGSQFCVGVLAHVLRRVSFFSLGSHLRFLCVLWWYLLSLFCGGFVSDVIVWGRSP